MVNLDSAHNKFILLCLSGRGKEDAWDVGSNLTGPDFFSNGKHSVSKKLSANYCLLRFCRFSFHM